MAKGKIKIYEPVSESDAVIDERTMMIEVCYAPVTQSTVFSSERSKTPAAVTQPRKNNIPLFPFIKIRNLELKSIVYGRYKLNLLLCKL